MTLTSNAAPAPLPSLTSNNSSASLSLKGDNQGSIAFAHNPVFHAHTKPIEIQHHYIRDEVAAGRIDLQYISNVRDDCKWNDKDSYPRQIPPLCQTDAYELKKKGSIGAEKHQKTKHLIRASI